MKLTATFVLFGMLQAVIAQSLAPSPTESIGCVPHEDHWHCEGPRPTEAAPEPTSAAPAPSQPAEDDDDHESHTDAEGTGQLAPSPTESIGCEPHGDHWHCEGPRPTGSASEGGDEPSASGSGSTPSQTTSSIVQVPTGAAAGLQIGNVVPVVAVALLAQAAF
ncbi:hypothetical protein SAPIO_CDS1520 [Scedosporium apiospermum]|uniref:Uncharacterized protein n=1 Tax=Pseudallescheria apiosperma TaxID=563466 RepID=A0A084GEG9_PSEDA|nr:uncharacterized protein SAPIO_CDS1520 [Scedosporium apiospermum]KEZ45731.1 hypothetical protein SAPIO_CDS1520 [Scedosporium apiospermum]